MCPWGWTWDCPDGRSETRSGVWSWFGGRSGERRFLDFLYDSIFQTFP